MTFMLDVDVGDSVFLLHMKTELRIHTRSSDHNDF